MARWVAVLAWGLWLVGCTPFNNPHENPHDASSDEPAMDAPLAVNPDAGDANKARDAGSSEASVEVGGEAAGGSSGDTSGPDGGDGPAGSALLALAPATGSSLDFGTVAIGSSVQRNYAVTNTGLAASSALTISASGAGFSVVAPAAGDCVTGVTTLDPGVSCTVNVAFAPTAVGMASATLSAHADSGGTPPPLTLTATGKRPTGVVTEYLLPTVGAQPLYITAGSDGNLWFDEETANKIGRITTAGVVTEFPVPTAKSGLTYITLGPDGNVWFTESFTSKICAITPAGAITEFAIPAVFAGNPGGIAAGGDGALWYGYSTSATAIGHMTTSGSFSRYDLPTPTSDADALAAAPDGTIWFAERYADKVGHVNANHVVVELSLPAGSNVIGVTAGPDGNMWFGERSSNKIARVTPAGVITEFTVPTASSGPSEIAAGPDGNLWFTEQTGNNIGRVTPSGTITEFPLPTASAEPWGIVAGSDGRLWFAEANVNKIAAITP
jgi:streptogramin lyase